MNNNTKMEFYCGAFGAIIPFFSMILTILLLTISGRSGIEYYWTAGLVALFVALCLAKKKSDVHHVAIEALSNPMFGTLTIIFLLAGVLSHMLRQSGLINGLVWLCTVLNVNGAIFPAVTFLTCVVISTSCGTQYATIATVTPIMFPLAVNMGCSPAVMLGAIISGAMFGDNLAPISDTTIASSTAMHAHVTDVVKSRIKYSLIAASVSAVLFITLGITTTNAVSSSVVADAAYAKTLVMLLVPVVMIVMMYRRSELIPVLLICNVVAAVLNLAFGFISLDKMVSMEGPVVVGMSGMVTVVIFNMFILILNGFLSASGVYDVLLEKLHNLCKTPRSTELTVMALIAIIVVFAVSGTVSIIIAGPFVYELFKKNNIDRHRGANFLDGTACAVGALLPWNDCVLAMFGLAAATGLLSSDFSVLNFIPYNFHAMMLLVVYFVCGVTGLFRKPDAKNYED